MSEDQKRNLETQLWAIADTLRGRVTASEYRDYILGFIFYKYLSEKVELRANEDLNRENLSFDALDPNNPAHQSDLDAIKTEVLLSFGCFLYPNQTFNAILNKAKQEVGGKFTNVVADLLQVFEMIQNGQIGTDNYNQFAGLFSGLDLDSIKLGNSAEEKNQAVVKILLALEKINFGIEDTESDILGDAYEFLISQFASDAGRNAGEFYTPQPVSKILAKIVTTGKKELQTAYDPTCGSGSLLLRIAKECTVENLYGQENNSTTYNLARMNMILRGRHFSRFDIQLGDTLQDPQHRHLLFDAIVANPPFSAQWEHSTHIIFDERFTPYGKFAPKTKADFAFVQHILAQLADNGTAAVVLPHGTLFRGGAEEEIRKVIIKKNNQLDAVIGLPANVFYGTSIPTCILVFKKCRTTHDVLFIDASQHFEKIKTQNILRPQDIDKITQTYQLRNTEPHFSRLVPLAEIEKNDFNLNIPRYVDTFVAPSDIDPNHIAQSLQSLDNDLQLNNNLLATFCSELQISNPF